MSLPEFNFFDPQAKADLSGLSRERLYNETGLRRLLKEGVVGRDKFGFYAYEKRKNIFGEDEVGEKFYVEDAYRHIERMIHNLYEAAYETRQKMLSLMPFEILKCQALHTETMVLDFKLLLLFDLYRGFITEDLWSPAQIDEWLQDQMDAGQLYDVLINLEESPLGVLARFAKSLQFGLQTGTEDHIRDHEMLPCEKVSGGSGAASSYAQPARLTRPQLTLLTNNTL